MVRSNGCLLSGVGCVCGKVACGWGGIKVGVCGHELKSVCVW